MTSPYDEYRDRRAAREATRGRVARLDLTISRSRLTAVGVAAVIVWLAARGHLSWWWMAAPMTAFAALAVWHDRVLGTLARLDRSLAFYDRGLDRLADRWHLAGDGGGRFLDADHLYARDLDIFGPGSLFQLLSLTRTHLGEGRLAHWLSTPATLVEVLDRQQAVEELRGALDFREALATAGGASDDIDTVSLSRWATAPGQSERLWLRAAAVIAATAIIITLVWWVRGGPATPLVLALIAKMLLTRSSRSRVAAVVRGIEKPLQQLDTLADTLSLIERSELTSARLGTIRADLAAGEITPSRAIRRLEHLAEMLDWRRNAFFAPLSAAVSWPLHLAAAIEHWRAEFGPRVERWLDAIAEHEALSSLAGYAYEHPQDPFPVFATDGPARFDGRALGHPLVPSARMVRNDVMLSGRVRMLIVSGSNMSGKSTLLRTVGVNVVLAMAGAPVRAAQLTLTPLAVGATLHVNDSLTAGQSRFFAEIKRIRAICDLLDPPAGAASRTPIFLLDELFQGTNSHDRRIGAEALLRHLIDRGAIGLTTTHDLALTAIAAQSGGRAVNVHFEDQLRDGALLFDYRMREGPVTHSNALALMHAVGLPVAVED